MKGLRASAAIFALIIMATMLCRGNAQATWVSIKSSSISDRSGSGQTVSASFSDYGVLGLTAPYGITTKVNSQLVSQCPNGELTNVQTELSMRNFFLYQMYNVTATAICHVAPPPPPPPPPPAPVQERIILRGVHFDFNKYNIRPDAAPILDEAAEILSKHPDVTVDVNGYCDIIGGVAYNQRLSERRANAVAGYLEGKGIPANRLVTHGYGKTNFVATNRTAEGRAQNRRVELVPINQ